MRMPQVCEQHVECKSESFYTEYFQRCTPEEISQNIDIFDTVKLNSGAYLFEEGQRGDAWYLVLEGEVSVVKSGESGPPHTLAQLGAGEGLGEMALLDDAGRVRELARMLGGVKLSDRTLAHAREMLDASQHAQH